MCLSTSGNYTQVEILMPYSVDEKHSPTEFCYPGETNYPNAIRFKAKITPSKTSTKTAKKKCFLIWSFLQSQKKLRFNKAMIINPLLTSFARSVRKSIAFPQAILSRTDRANEVNKSSIVNTSKFTQQCNVVPYYYAVYWLRQASSAFSFARKCN